jgi:hypothetical protein
MPTADQVGMRTWRMLAFLLFLGLGGCLEIEQTVTVSPTGSGRQTMRMVIRDATLKEVERVSSAAEAGSTELAKAVFDKELVARELGEAGLVLESHQAERKANRRTVELAATFPSFAALQKSPLTGSRAEWELGPGPKAGTARLTLYPQGKAAWVEARAQGRADADRGPMRSPRRSSRSGSRSLAGLDLTLRFQLPGDVLVWTANMEKTGVREVDARITAAQIKTPQELVRRLAPRFEVIFDARGCKLPLKPLSS